MSRLISWFVKNPIAANLLMVLILAGGIFNMVNLNKEVFPRVETNLITISIFYPGAGPSEVEELVVKRVEESVDGVNGIEEITSTAQMGMAQVTIESVNGYDMQRLMNDVKSRVDAIDTFPQDAEEPVIKEVLGRTEVMSVAVYGDSGEKSLKDYANRLRDELALLPEISQVEINGARDDEMAIEISEQQLRRYGLSFDQVVKAVREASINLPAGTIKSERGDIQLQTRGQAYTANQFAEIVVEQREDGAQLLLKDIATITDGFTEDDVISRLNGQPAIFLELSITENPDVLSAAEAVTNHLESVQSSLPDGVHAVVWRDWSKLFKGRMNLLLKNASSGLVLVFIVLMLFLRPALAMWVCIGIAIAFLGAVWLLPYTGVSIHMISLFAFLMVLGILVDDAIIVAESIHSEQHRGGHGNEAAIAGAQQVSKPVLFAVISTMVFFAPMLTIPGGMGDMAFAIPVVVCLALLFSLIESLLILPSHLSHLKPENPDNQWRWLQPLERWREKLADAMLHFSDNVYRPTLEKLLHQSGTVIATFVVLFGLSVALLTGGWLDRSFMPVVPSDFIRLQARLPEGTAFREVESLLNKIETAIDTLEQDGKLLAENSGRPFIQHKNTSANGVEVKATLSLEDGDRRTVGSSRVRERLYQLLGELPETEEFDIRSSINSPSKDIQLNLSMASEEEELMSEAVRQVRDKLARYPGVYEIKDTLTAARTEIEIDLKPHAETLDLSLQSIAQQLRYGFYGAEAQRIPRGKEDVRVMVRYPREERAEVAQLDEMRIRTSDSREIPLETVAELNFVPGYTTIKRVDRRRSITITAEVEPGTSDPALIVTSIIERNLAHWQKLFPGFTLTVEGDMEEQSKFTGNIVPNFFLAMMLIYGLMAVAFRSYAQPVLILTAVPFGFMGAIVGHLIMGREVSFLSILGFVACAGVVVNDNLVLLDRINQLRKQGVDVLDAVLQGGRDRFRPIILTSITTFIGLTPIMAETSTQARFLIPMVISLSFGVLLATTVTLLLVPCLYVMGQRCRGAIQRGKDGKYQGVEEGV